MFPKLLVLTDEKEPPNNKPILSIAGVSSILEVKVGSVVNDELNLLFPTLAVNKATSEIFAPISIPVSI